jgi:hypothetical protein
MLQVLTNMPTSQISIKYGLKGSLNITIIIIKDHLTQFLQPVQPAPKQLAKPTETYNLAKFY